MRVLQTEDGYYLDSLEGRFRISETTAAELRASLTQEPGEVEVCSVCGGTGLRCAGAWPWGKGYEVCGCQAETPRLV